MEGGRASSAAVLCDCRRRLIDSLGCNQSKLLMDTAAAMALGRLCENCTVIETSPDYVGHRYALPIYHSQSERLCVNQSESTQWIWVVGTAAACVQLSNVQSSAVADTALSASWERPQALRLEQATPLRRICTTLTAPLASCWRRTAEPRLGSPHRHLTPRPHASPPDLPVLNGPGVFEHRPAAVTQHAHEQQGAPAQPR